MQSTPPLKDRLRGRKLEYSHLKIILETKKKLDTQHPKLAPCGLVASRKLEKPVTIKLFRPSQVSTLQV